MHAVTSKIDRLYAELAAAQHRLWQPGRHDCLAFAVHCAAAQLGVPVSALAYDPAAHGDWPGKAEVLRRHGTLRGVCRWLAEQQGWPPCRHPKSPPRGAFVVTSLIGPRGASRPMAGVMDEGLLTAARPAGYCRMPVSMLTGTESWIVI